MSDLILPTRAEANRWRKSLGLSVPQLAELLGGSLRHVATVQNPRDAKPSTSADNATQIAVALLMRHPDTLSDLMAERGITPRFAARAERRRELWQRSVHLAPPSDWWSVDPSDSARVLAILRDLARKNRTAALASDPPHAGALSFAMAVDAAVSVLEGSAMLTDDHRRAALALADSAWGYEFSMDHIAQTRDPVAAFVENWGDPTETVPGPAGSGILAAYYWSRVVSPGLPASVLVVFDFGAVRAVLKS